MMQEMTTTTTTNQYTNGIAAPDNQTLSIGRAIRAIRESKISQAAFVETAFCIGSILTVLRGAEIGENMDIFLYTCATTVIVFNALFRATSPVRERLARFCKKDPILPTCIKIPETSLITQIKDWASEYTNLPPLLLALFIYITVGVIIHESGHAKINNSLFEARRPFIVYPSAFGAYTWFKGSSKLSQKGLYYGLRNSKRLVAAGGPLFAVLTGVATRTLGLLLTSKSEASIALRAYSFYAFAHHCAYALSADHWIATNTPIGSIFARNDSNDFIAMKKNPFISAIFIVIIAPLLANILHQVCYQVYKRGLACLQKACLTTPISDSLHTPLLDFAANKPLPVATTVA